MKRILQLQSVLSRQFSVGSTRYFWDKMSDDSAEKLKDLNNAKIESLVEEYCNFLNPESVLILSDSMEDREIIRNLAMELGEESQLAIDRHTIHYDGYFNNSNHDQARDTGNTKTLLPPGTKTREGLNIMERDEGLDEVLGIMDGIMEGKTMFVRFYCLGPVGSEFSEHALQITDSAYVCHSEDLLYRPGYESFKENITEDDIFFHHVHSAGELTDKGHTKNLDQRRIYIDPNEYRVFSANNQYAGNSVGLKKLSLRLAIWKCNIEQDWLAEHMFISGFEHPGVDGLTYLAGAFPSACGKTSTAMIDGAQILGDDIAYFRPGPDGELRAVNIELGIFGIIRDVSEYDDPNIFEAITVPGAEVIFSNILKTDDGKVWWDGMGVETPTEGYNHSGEWTLGKTDENDAEIPISHPNARFTVKLDELKNCDPALHDPEGVRLSGIFYGGRDSDTTVPLVETFDWNHGIFVGAGIESETTSAIVGGDSGKKVSQPFSNMDFIVVPLGQYINNHVEFGKKMSDAPRVYGCNYFLRDPETGEQLNPKIDTKIWLLWAIARSHNEDYATHITTPIGRIPTYESLCHIFETEQGREYPHENYVEQFSIRSMKYLEKFRRMENLYKDEGCPKEFNDILDSQIKEMENLLDIYGDVHVSPYEFV